MKTSNDIDTIKKLLAPVFQKNEVIKAVVFGSASKGSETKKSDLDLMIIKDTRKRFFDRYDEFDEIFKLIKDRAIDILIYTPEELESISHRPFIKMIINERQPIYEQWINPIQMVYQISHQAWHLSMKMLILVSNIKP